MTRVDRRGRDDEGADEPVEVEAGCADQEQDVLDPVDQRGAQHDPEDGSAAAGQQQSADHAGRDRLQRKREARVGRDDARARRRQHRGERCADAGDRERQHLDAGDADAVRDRRGAVAADGEEVVAHGRGAAGTARRRCRPPTNHSTSAGTTPMSPDVSCGEGGRLRRKGIDELLMSSAALVQTPAVPSVVMKEGTLSPTVIRPLSDPIAPPTARHSERGGERVEASLGELRHRPCR